MKNFASVALGYSMTRPKLHRVANHHIESMRMALRELKRREYRRTALVMHEMQDRRVNHNWSAGYLTFQQKLPVLDRLPIYMSDEFNPKKLSEWIKKHAPDVIICATTNEATWLAELNLKVPEDIALAYMNADAKVAGIDQQGELTGAAAVDIIVGQIHRNDRGVPETPKVILTEGK